MTVTAKVLKIAVESGLYKDQIFMCWALNKLIDYAEYGEIIRLQAGSPKLLKTVRALEAKWLTAPDVKLAMCEVSRYVESLDNRVGARLIDNFTIIYDKDPLGFAYECGDKITKTLTPLYLDWDNRPRNDAEVVAYMEKHYVE